MIFTFSLFTPYLIILLTLGISCYGFVNRSFYYRCLLYPCQIWTGDNLGTLFISGFVHNNRLHLISNLFVIYTFSIALHEKFVQYHLQANLQFLLIYLVSILTGNLFTVLLHHKDLHYRAAGASGGAWGLMVSYVLFDPLGDLIYIPGIKHIANIIWVGIYGLGIFYLSWKKRKAPVNYGAHLYGGIGGLLVTLILDHQVIYNKF